MTSSMTSRVSASAQPVGARFVNPRSEAAACSAKTPGARNEKFIAMIWRRAGQRAEQDSLSYPRGKVELKVRIFEDEDTVRAWDGHVLRG